MIITSNHVTIQVLLEYNDQTVYNTDVEFILLIFIMSFGFFDNIYS